MAHFKTNFTFAKSTVWSVPLSKPSLLKRTLLNRLSASVAVFTGTYSARELASALYWRHRTEDTEIWKNSKALRRRTDGWLIFGWYSTDIRRYMYHHNSPCLHCLGFRLSGTGARFSSLDSLLSLVAIDKPGHYPDAKRWLTMQGLPNTIIVWFEVRILDDRGILSEGFSVILSVKGLYQQMNFSGRLWWRTMGGLVKDFSRRLRWKTLVERFGTRLCRKLRSKLYRLEILSAEESCGEDPPDEQRIMPNQFALPETASSAP